MNDVVLLTLISGDTVIGVEMHPRYTDSHDRTHLSRVMYVDYDSPNWLSEYPIDCTVTFKHDHVITSGRNGDIADIILKNYLNQFPRIQ